MVLEIETMLAKKYILGEYIDPLDKYMINKMGIVGLMHTGLDIDTMRETAKTTNFGVRAFDLTLYKKQKQLQQWLFEKLTF